MKYFDYREHRQQGTADFPVAFYHIDPNHPRYQMPYHWHPEYEIIRILEGSFHLTIGSRIYYANKGDILFLQDGALHGGIPEHCVYECLVFDMNFFLQGSRVRVKLAQRILRHEIVFPELLPSDFELLPSSFERLPGSFELLPSGFERLSSGFKRLPDEFEPLPNGFKPLRDTVEKLFLAVAEKKDGYELLTQGYLYQLLGFFFQEHLYEEKAAAEHTSSQHVPQFKRVLDYIEEHYTGRITLEDLAKAAGMNPKYFCRFFREMSYRTPIDYVNYYRIERACEQLSTTNAPIIEVALNCGYNDVSYFIKTFRRYKGMTPKQYTKATTSGCGR